MSAPAWLSKSLDDGRILCEACHQHCKLREGKYGVCGIRKVENGALQLLTYGIAAALNVDPIEKKPMFHFLPASTAFSVGTVGCNFACRFCQNAEISQYPKEHDHKIVGQPLSPEQIVTLAQTYGAQSIAYTYNEPVVFFEYTYDTARRAKAAGLQNVYVTSGFETHKALDTLRPYLDGMNIDLKAFSEDFYRDVCGAKLQPLLDTIRYAHTLGIWIEVTTLLIPGKNDSDDEIRAMARFLADLDPDIPWHLSGFYPMYKMQDLPRTPASTLERAWEIAKDAGVRYPYVGNRDDETRESTTCPSCGFRVIRRHGHIGQHVTNAMRDAGRCPQCGGKIAGVWA